MGAHQARPSPPWTSPHEHLPPRRTLPQRKGVGRTCGGTRGHPGAPRPKSPWPWAPGIPPPAQQTATGGCTPIVLSEAHRNIPASVSTFQPGETLWGSCLAPEWWPGHVSVYGPTHTQGWQAACHTAARHAGRRPPEHSGLQGGKKGRPVPSLPENNPIWPTGRGQSCARSTCVQSQPKEEWGRASDRP